MMEEESKSPSSECKPRTEDQEKQQKQQHQQMEMEERHQNDHQCQHQHHHGSSSSRPDTVKRNDEKNNNQHASADGADLTNRNKGDDETTTSRILAQSVIVHGVRYVRPYLQFQQYSIRLHHDKMPILDVLSTVFDRAHCSPQETKRYFTTQILEGRIEYRKSPTKRKVVGNHQNHQNQNGHKNKHQKQQRQLHQQQQERPQFEIVKDPNFVVSKNERLRIMRHVHERCTIGKPIHDIPIIVQRDDTATATANTNTTTSRCSGDIDSKNNTTSVVLPTTTTTSKSKKRRSRADQEKEQLFRAVFKPTGLPVIGGEGETSSCTGDSTSKNGSTSSSSRIDSCSLQGLMRQRGGWYAGHRIDQPVSGIVLFGKGKGRAKQITEQLSPDMKRQQQDHHQQQQQQQQQRNTTNENDEYGEGGFIKAYLARVHGRPRFMNKLSSDFESGEKRPKLCTEESGRHGTSSFVSGNGVCEGDGTMITSKKVEIRCQLIWNSRRRKSVVVGIDDHIEFDSNDRDGLGTVRCTQKDTNVLPVVTKRKREESIGQNTNPAIESNESSNEEVPPAAAAAAEPTDATTPTSTYSTKGLKKSFSSKARKDTTTYIQLIEYDPRTHTSLVRVELLTGARQQIRAVLGTLLRTPIVGDTTYGGKDFNELFNSGGRSTKNTTHTTTTTTTSVVGPSSFQTKNNIRLYRDDQDGTLRRMLEEEYQPWCDKCRWQLECCRGSNDVTTTTAPTTTTTTGATTTIDRVILETSDSTEHQRGAKVGGEGGGGTRLGVRSLTHQICLLSYHYRIPSLGIDAVVPDHMIPDWARTNESSSSLQEAAEAGTLLS